MNHLLTHWDEIAAALTKAPAWFLALDFDGVLSPIVPDYKKAKILSGTRKALDHLSKIKKVHVAAISGRSISDLSSRVKLRDVLYSGNHGLEWMEGDKVRYAVDPERYRPALVTFKHRLQELTHRMHGVVIQDKGLCVTVHYRRLRTVRIPAFKKKFAAMLQDLPPGLTLLDGKRIYEVRPDFPWDKGKAFLKLWTMTGKRALPLVFGDDLTDEHAFEVANRYKAITVYVGAPRPTAAQWALNSPHEVQTFLKKLLSLAQKKF